MVENLSFKEKIVQNQYHMGGGGMRGGEGGGKHVSGFYFLYIEDILIRSKRSHLLPTHAQQLPPFQRPMGFVLHREQW